MTTMQKVVVAVARLGVGFLATAVAACGTATGGAAASKISPSSSVTTLMAGWEQKFAVEWEVGPEPGGTQRIQGYVVSRYGQHAEPVRVLGQALDGSGALVGQRIAWVPSGVPGFGRAYFQIPQLPSADHYLVTVWTYSILESETIIR